MNVQTVLTLAQDRAVADPGRTDPLGLSNESMSPGTFSQLSSTSDGTADAVSVMAEE